MTDGNTDDGNAFLTRRIAALTSSLSVSVLGFSLLDNPEGFVLAVLYRALVDAAVSTAGEIGLIVLNIWQILTSAIVGGLGAAVRLPLSLVGGLILEGIAVLNDIAIQAGAAAGPFGLIVIPIVWSVATVMAVAVVFGAFRVYRWVRTVVV